MTPEGIQVLLDSLQVVTDAAARADAEYTLAVLQILMASVTTLGVALLAFFQHKSHKQFNSRMDELMKAKTEASFLAGQQQEKDDQIIKSKITVE